jgi:6-phosphogluconolactonase
VGTHEFLQFPSSPLLIQALAARIGDLLLAAMERNADGQASLLVSGGSTPIPLFTRLAGMELPWHRVTISLVDERWVEPGSPDSNEHLVRAHLLQHQAARARFIPMKTDDATAAGAEERCAAALRTIPRPHDCLILGMGNDGHTASLFPGADNLAAATDLYSEKICMAMAPVAAAHQRMTLTLAAILGSRQLFLHLQGDEKKGVLARAMEAGDPREMPIRFILRQETTPLAIYWSP